MLRQKHKKDDEYFETSDEPENKIDDPDVNDANSDSETAADADRSEESPGGSSTKPEAPSKKKKRGIIYLSTIPKHMTVSIAREMFSQYADVGRMFFQPSTKTGDDGIIANKKKKTRRQTRQFAEGWIEFESKRAAKHVAGRLNNQAIATRKSSKFYDILWSMKYLPRFKWVHLSERLTYEKAAYKQKLAAEISQARREAAFFQDNLDKSDKNKRLSKKEKLSNKPK